MDNNDNNKSVWNEPFYKERNIGKCLSAGVSLISNRFIKIIKLASPVIAVTAVVFTLVTLAFCNAGFEYQLEDSLIFKGVAVVISLAAVSSLAAFAYRCVDVNIEGLNIYSIGYKYTYSKEFWRKLLVAFIVCAIALIVFEAMMLLANLAVNFFDDNQDVEKTQNGFSMIAIIAYGIGLVLVTLLITPLYMALSSMMISKNNLYKDFKEGYLLGWKKWGRIFALDVFINVIMTVMAVFLLSPAYVTSLMMHSATLSRMQGDAVDIPSYFTALTVVVLFLSSVISAIIIITRFIPHAYFYANVMTEDKDNENNTNKK
jgi:hypothetical protein